MSTVPTRSAFSHSAAAPPGEASTSSAAPSQTKSIASVTTMSGTRVSTMSAPLMAPNKRPRARMSGTTRIANSSLAPSIRTAAVTLVSAIIDAIDRSTPPAMTTMVCAAAANAKGRAARASDPKPAVP
jgi:hypothetical protein